MAQIEITINDVPQEILQQIMVKVAATPYGVVDTFNSYFISKDFHGLSKDDQILKTVVFKDLSTYCLKLCDPSSLLRWDGSTPDLSSEFEAFQKIGGYIHRAAVAGNSSAQMILAKLILKSTAEAFRGLSSLLSHEIKQGKGKDRSIRNAKAKSFIAHFMPGEAGDTSTGKKLVHYELVKKFLAQASLEEVEEMWPYLGDYVVYFCERRAEDSCNNFLALLDEMNELNTSVFLRICAQSYARSFNSLCVSSRRYLRALGVDVSLQFHKLPKTSEIQFLEPDEVENRFTAVEAILAEAIEQVLGPNRTIKDFEKQLPSMPISNTIRRTLTVKEGLLKYKKHVEEIGKMRANIISEFKDIFNIKDD